eukprot:Em0008g609a
MGDVDVLARTLWGEARGEGRTGMEAVASVIINRVDWPHEGSLWWGNTVEEVCKKPSQFAVWNAGDPNLAPMLAVTDADPQFRTALEIARQAVARRLHDPNTWRYTLLRLQHDQSPFVDQWPHTDCNYWRARVL